MHLPLTHLQKRFKSPSPGANLIYWREPDATDLIYYDMPAIDGGETMAHIFVDLILRITDVFKAKTASLAISVISGQVFGSVKANINIRILLRSTTNWLNV